MTEITVRDVHKKFGATEVIRGISLDIEDGAFVVLVGPSGCGKSTLLRMIGGLEDITSGEVSVGGRVVNDVPPKDRDIAMVFQNYALYPHMSVAQNMGFSLRLRGAPKAEISAAVARAADILGLSDYLGRYPRQLSGGQRQRVAMGRAIVRDPQVFLFDEPLSNLDANLRLQMRTEIKELHQRLRTTTIFVTHDQIEAMTMADKVVVMRDGHIEQMGTPLEVYDEPVSLFVARFIGSPSMNTIPGTIRTGATATFHSDDGIVLPLPFAPSASDGMPAIYGIRPEHIAIDDEGVPATVVLIEPTGAETQVFARVGSHSLIGSFRERTNVRVGDTVRLAPHPGAIHLFDKESGRRLRTTAAMQTPGRS